MNIQIICKICFTPVKITDTHIRFQCICDEDVRVLSKEDIYNDEHCWRITFSNEKIKN